MNELSRLKKYMGILKNPGDSLNAKITKTGLPVVSLKVGDVKKTEVFYPSTNRVVTTVSRQLQ